MDRSHRQGNGEAQHKKELLRGWMIYIYIVSWGCLSSVFRRTRHQCYHHLKIKDIQLYTGCSHGDQWCQNVFCKDLFIIIHLYLKFKWQLAKFSIENLQKIVSFYLRKCSGIYKTKVKGKNIFNKKHVNEFLIQFSGGFFYLFQIRWFFPHGNFKLSFF